MAGGISKGVQAGYNEYQYATPWPGLQLDRPSNAIDPGACVSCNASQVRGRLTCQPAIYPATDTENRIVPQNNPLIINEQILYITNAPLPGGDSYTVFVTNHGTYTDYSVGQVRKSFNLLSTAFSVIEPNSVGSVVIGQTLYISTSDRLGVYAITSSGGPPAISEISAQNGSGPFIGANYLGTIGQRLVLGNIIGGDGNTTGSVTGVIIVSGGTGYPASGDVAFIGGGGSGATGTFTAIGGVINSITITNGGSLYVASNPPAVSIITTSGGTGFSGTATVSSAASPSTSTHYPDYFAWSFPNAFGQFDPNNSLTPGGFDQLTEARGEITGLAVFQSVVFAGHDGGITEITPNTSNNIVPFTYNPLWSSDQGIIVRKGSMSQYGTTVAFLGKDNAHILSPNGLMPIGDAVSFALQDMNIQEGGFRFGTIVQIDGELHYLLAQSAIFESRFGTIFFIYDYSFKTQSWFYWDYLAFGNVMTCAVHQSNDWQNVISTNEDSRYDNWLVLGISNNTTGFATLAELAVGQRLLQLEIGTPLFAQRFSYLFRCETPASARLQTERRVLIEYENIPQLFGSAATLNMSLTGQNSPSLTNTNAMTTQTSFAVDLVYPTTPVQPSQILTVQSEPVGPAFTSCGSMLEISSSGILNLSRVTQVNELQKSEIQ